MRYQAFFHTHVRSTYEEFTQQDILLSQPLSFHWIQQNTLFTHNTFLKQKVPLKVYLGAVFSSQEPTHITQCLSYTTQKQTFEEVSAGQFIPKLRALEEYLQKEFSTNLHISFLTDTTSGKGLCFYQSIACLLSMLYFFEEHRWPMTSIQTLTEDNEQHEHILEKAREIYQVMTGDTTPTRLFHPIGLFEGSSPTLSTPDTFKKQTDLRIEQLNDDFPFYIGLIHSGKNTHANLQQQRTLKLQQQLSKGKNTNTFETTSHYLQQMTYDMANCFQKLNEEGAITEHINKLFALCDMSTAQIRFLEEIHPQLSELLTKLEYLAARHPQCNSTFLPIGTTKLGGSIIVCFTEYGFGQTLQEWTNEQQQTGYPYSLEYLSSTQGSPPKEGITVHTYRSRNIIPITNETTHSFLHIQQGIETSLQIPAPRLQEHYQHTPLLIDLQGKRIYLHGERMTAKDLPSQSSTVEILNLLFQHQSKHTYRLSNQNLPPSSYAQSRNEMYSKILTPLKRAIKHHSGYDFPIQCQGSNHEFDIILEIPEFSVLIKHNKHQRYTPSMSSLQEKIHYCTYCLR